MNYTSTPRDARTRARRLASLALGRTPAVSGSRNIRFFPIVCSSVDVWRVARVGNRSAGFLDIVPTRRHPHHSEYHVARPTRHPRGARRRAAVPRHRARRHPTRRRGRAPMQPRQRRRHRRLPRARPSRADGALRRALRAPRRRLLRRRVRLFASHQSYVHTYNRRRRFSEHSREPKAPADMGPSPLP